MHKDKIELFYITHHKTLLWIPIIILIIATATIGFKYATTGDFFNKDVSLKGGLTGIINTEVPINSHELEQALPFKSKIRTLADPTTNQQLGFIIETSEITAEELETTLEKELNRELTEQDFSVEETSASLGQSFYQDLILALIIALILMGTVVFITFRAFIPSIAIILAGVADIIITLAIVNTLNIELSTAGIVAFLLVIGYSIDSDILLTTNVLKKKGNPLFDRMLSATKTGLTMTSTTIGALLVAFFFVTSPTLKQMFLIIVIALVIDIFTTYFTNAGLLYIYCKKKRIQ